MFTSGEPGRRVRQHELSRRCVGVLIGLTHALHILFDAVLKTIVTALVVSRVQYCLSAEMVPPRSSTDSKKIYQPPLVIFGRRKCDHVSDLRDLLRWMSQSHG